MKKSNEFIATCSALTWSAEDIDINVQRMNDAGVINDFGAKHFLNMPNADKLIWLEQILEDCHDEFCQIINERIGDSIYDNCLQNPNLLGAHQD